MRPLSMTGPLMRNAIALRKISLPDGPQSDELVTQV